jgi:hypothetical protein
MDDHLNPWLTVPSVPPYWLPCDYERIRAYNAKHPNECYKVQDKVLPEPLIGKMTAPVVLLNLNPGFDDRNTEEHARTEFQALIRNNYSQGEAAFPFYHLDPRFQSGGRQWWEKKLSQLIDMRGREQVAQKILCIEYFPYHSWQFNHASLEVSSQVFGFDLASSAIARNAVVVIMRSKARWLEKIPGLKGYPRAFTLNSSQNVVVSRRNFPEAGEGFELVVSAIRDGDGRKS